MAVRPIRPSASSLRAYRPVLDPESMKRCVPEKHHLLGHIETFLGREVHAMEIRTGTLTFARGRGNGPRSESQFFNFSNSVRQAVAGLTGTNFGFSPRDDHHLHQKGIQETLRKAGIDLDGLRRCLEEYCRKHTPGQPSQIARAELSDRFRLIVRDDQLLSAVMREIEMDEN